jgi:hypothetical protein
LKGYVGMNNIILQVMTFLILPLPLVEEAKDNKEEKPKAMYLVKFLVIQRAGSTASAPQPTSSCKVTRVSKGTVAEWIDFQKAILEIRRLNNITNTQDRVANFSTVLRGDLLTGFEEKFKISLLQQAKQEKLLLYWQNRFSELKCCRFDGVSFLGIGNPDTVDVMSHVKAQVAFSLEDRGPCQKA